MLGICGGLLLVFLSGFHPEGLLTDPSVCRDTHQSVCQDKCIPFQWLCNGEKDCPDGSDEQCAKPCSGDEGAWQCDNGRCISGAQRCDGASDCLDGSDECDCACPGDKILCPLSGECIDRWNICDGDEDCDDGSDEQICSTKSCMANQVQCKNKVCIMESWMCDGINNCGDGSDEDGCEFCEGLYKCGDGTCLNNTQVCNNVIDCPDGSDEASSCGSCSSSNGGCMQNCKDTAWGVSCSCNEGWKLHPNGQSCVDLDECSLEYSPCHQLCDNSEGVFTCGCTEGFALKGKTVCEVTGNSSVILVAKKGEIGTLDAKTGNYQTLLSIHGHPTAVTYYLSKDACIWIDENGSLEMSSGGKNYTSLYPDATDISSVSVDWLTGQLYWASKEQEVISVGLLDRRGHLNLFENDVKPDQLLVFPINRYMYWVNYGNKGITTIESAGMDGSDRHVITYVPMEQPLGLTIDRFASRLYWISEYKESIETVRFDGSGRFTFPDVLQNVPNALGLAVFEGWFFVVDEKRLLSLSRDNPTERRLLLNTDNISSINVLHDLQQPTNEVSPCFPQICSHLCLLSPVSATSFKCACPLGLSSLPSGKCENLKMIYGTPNGIYLTELGFQGAFVKKSLIRQAKGIHLMDVDWKRDLVYWTDEHGLMMCSNGVLGTFKVFHTGGAVCMAKVDIPTGNIYWIPCQRNEIYVTKHSGTGTKVIYESEYSLQHLLLNWEAKLLYIVEDGTSVRQMSLDGQEVQTILNGTSFMHMSLDLKSQSLLWKSQDEGLYSFSLLKGRNSRLKENFPSTLMDTLEPYVLSYNNSIIEIWERRTMKQFSSFHEANLTKVILIASSHVKGSHSSCELDNGGCTSKEICISGSSNSVNCLCPDDQISCSEELVLPEKTPLSELVCPRSFVRCQDGTDCVSYEYVCDGEKDCMDGSDEENCPTFCEDEGLFKCLNGTQCIEKKYHCDGVRHCIDGSDEENCWKPTEACAIRCDKPERCIPQSWICDGRADCTDMSDEKSCEHEPCSENKFQCMNGECIPYVMHCDGDKDCNDHSDEKNCSISKPVYCQAEDFKCQSGECILKTWTCDGDKDCKDGSDEKGCRVDRVTCESMQWPCASEDQCIPDFWRCDGSKDCRDGSDEFQCDLLKCKNNTFRCKNFDCVPINVVCDGRDDCLDKSDEGGKCDVPCEGCPFACYKTPYGPKCFCDTGFKLSSDMSLCIDINECKELDPPPCSQSCSNKNGTYNCFCHPGYALQTDGHQCKVTGTEPVLLVAVQFRLILYKLRTGEEEILTSTDKSSLIFSVDYDLLEQRVFWMDLNAESIRWITIGTKAKGTLVKGIKTDCIAVDWVGRNLYWTDGIAGQILATSMNTSWRGYPEYVVVLEDLDQPRSLVLQPLEGLMYWSEIGEQPLIQQAGMDGSQIRSLITEQLGWPTGLALDLVSWKIYWSDDKLHSIGSANLDGTHIKVIQIKNIQSPFALTVFEDEVYWSEIAARTVQKMNKQSGKNMSVLIKRHGQPYGLKVIHEVLQPRTKNPCAKLKCSHVCIIGPLSRGSCRCPSGLVLSDNMLDCISFKNLPFLVVATPGAVFQIYLKTLQMDSENVAAKTEIATLINSKPLSCFDYILHDRTLVFAVKSGGYMASMKVKDGNSKDWKKVMHVEDSVLSIAVDWITGNIFWISTYKPFIQAASSNGMFRTVAVKDDLYRPSCIVLYPTKGIMCYFDAGSETLKSVSKIECAAMDGTERKVLWKRSNTVVGLTFSDSGNKLYWADRESGTIESINVDGSDHVVIQSRLRGLNLFTAGHEFLLWTVVKNGTTNVFYTRMNTNEMGIFEVDQPVDLKIYSGLTQQGSNACSEKNGGCSQICLANPRGRTCHCSSTYQLVNTTYCIEQLDCPQSSWLCKDGLKCVQNDKICDGKQDCSDASDEKNCAYRNKNQTPGRSETFTKQTTSRQLAYPRLNYATEEKMYPKIKSTTTETISSPDDETDEELEGFERKLESRPCTRETCNMKGECVLENDAIICKCELGYNGMYCEDQLQPLAVPLTLGTLAVLFVAGIIAGGFVYVSRRKALQRTSSSASSRTLTRPSKDSDPLESKHVESTETFLNSAFDAEGNVTE